MEGNIPDDPKGVTHDDGLDVGPGDGLLDLVDELVRGDHHLGLAVDKLAPDLPRCVRGVEGCEHEAGLGGRHQEDRVLGDIGEDGGHHLARLAAQSQEAAGQPP